MWLFTETGFVSVVADPQDKDKMVVRARDKASLQPLMDEYGVKMVNLKNRDYPHRVFLTRKQFVDWLVQAGEDLTYTNYKNRVSQTRGYDFASPLHDVWATMLRLEDLGKPKKKFVDEYEDDFYYRNAYYVEKERNQQQQWIQGHS